jgi:hypothetical protein
MLPKLPSQAPLCTRLCLAAAVVLDLASATLGLVAQSTVSTSRRSTCSNSRRSTYSTSRRSTCTYPTSRLLYELFLWPSKSGRGGQGVQLPRCGAWVHQFRTWGRSTLTTDSSYTLIVQLYCGGLGAQPPHSAVRKIQTQHKINTSKIEPVLH